MEELLKEISQKLDSLKDSLRPLLERPSPPPPAPEHKEHKVLKSESAGDYFCVDCGERFTVLRDTPRTVLDFIKKHPHVGFFECETCRPAFIQTVKEAGYEVVDRGGEIVIRRRRK